MSSRPSDGMHTVRTAGVGFLLPEGRWGVSTGDAEHVPQLRADYWLDPDDDRGLVLLAFSSPLLPLRDDLVEPFDSIVAGVRRVHDEDATAGPTETAA
ncbi:hypothetical protein ACTHAM_001052 [Cellulomonas soli]|uniref:hypothetical protein n=1 Tax=Cellulomonas soli TaxID=931535 RepID=UPI001D6EB269|nr:hypothetical protein [Cellulomonadaceae bacterium]